MIGGYTAEHEQKYPQVPEAGPNSPIEFRNDKVFVSLILSPIAREVDTGENYKVHYHNNWDVRDLYKVNKKYFYFYC